MDRIAPMHSCFRLLIKQETGLTSEQDFLGRFIYSLWKTLSQQHRRQFMFGYQVFCSNYLECASLLLFQNSVFFLTISLNLTAQLEVWPWKRTSSWLIRLLKSIWNQYCGQDFVINQMTKEIQIFLNSTFNRQLHWNSKTFILKNIDKGNFHKQWSVGMFHWGSNKDF